MSVDIPVALQLALDEAEESIAASPEGELALPYRRRIWDALGEGTEGHGSRGHRRRTALDLLTVERVQPIWDQTYPDDPSVAEVIDAARQVLDGRQSVDWADDLRGRAWVSFLNRMNADHQFPAGYVGAAATAALSTAARDKRYSTVPIDADDYDLDSEDWDTSFMAAMASAGGEVGDPVASDERRRDFWEWYLQEAVPEAWRAAGRADDVKPH